MKTFVSCIFLILSYFSFSQSSTTFFVQAQINELSSQEMTELESVLRNNPYVLQARIDVTNGQVIVVSKDLQALNESDFRSWTGLNAAQLSCVFVGTYGVDVFQVYPFTNCSN